MSEVVRETRESRVRVALELAMGAGAGALPASAATGEPFLDHMLIALARHAGWSLEVEARGDLRHHLIEDVAITLGRAVFEAAPATVTRYGDRTVAMDEALVQVVLDAGGRAFYAGPLPSGLYDHWMRSFAGEARCTLHLRVLRGTDRHHVIEAAFKALGLALRDALTGTDAMFSTKGAVQWTVR
jgi:imidazoleglycerol-phosphate dehydratase